MEQLKAMKQQLMTAAQAQMGNLSEVNAKELGEVIDMVKDLEEAIYYCTVVEAMEKNKESEKAPQNTEEALRYYTPMYYVNPRRYYWDEGMRENRYYAEGQDHGRMDSSNTNYYTDSYPMARRRYYTDKEKMRPSAQDLEEYMNELTDDITDIIKQASADEKTKLKNKLTTLANKI